MGRVVWLADGRALLITASDERSLLAQQIWRISYPNGEAQKITNDLNDYRTLGLTADSKTLIAAQMVASSFLFPTARGLVIFWRMNIDGSPPAQLTDFKSERIFWFDWSRDGKALACARGGITQDVVVMSDLE